MSYKLTFSDKLVVKVNNVVVTSPYILQNNDVITMSSIAGYMSDRYAHPFTVNGMPVDGIANNKVFNINNEDIELLVTSNVKLPENINATINYTETATDTIPVFKYTDNTWKKQNAFQYTNGNWNKISTAPTGYQLIVTATRGNNPYASTYEVNGTEHSLTDGPNATVGSGSMSETYDGVSTFKLLDIGDGGTAYLNGSYSTGTEITINTVYNITSNSTVNIYTNYCFVKGTLITLADGTTKRVEDITYDDYILTYDFDAGCFMIRQPCWIAKSAISPCYWETEFSDGTILKTVGANNKSHRIFNFTKQKFIYPQDWDNNDVAFAQSSKTPSIVRCEKIYDEVEYYNFTTTFNMNCFANGILCGCRYTNVYPIKNMRYVKTEVQNHPREEYPNIPDILYYGLRLAEQPTTTQQGEVKYFNTTAEHVLHNYVEHELNYTGEKDYKRWVYKEKHE